MRCAGLDRLLLVESITSPAAATIAAAAEQLSLPIETVEAMDRPPAAPAEDVVVAIGPSVYEPLQVARRLQAIGPTKPLIVFVPSASGVDALQAELVRDPVVGDRVELVPIDAGPRQVARRLRDVLQSHTPADEPSERSATPTKQTPGSPGRPTLPSADVTDQYLASILAQASEAILSTDDRACIRSWNAAAERLFGYPAEDVLGEPLRYLDLGDSGQGLGAVADHVLASRVPEHLELACRRADGSSIQVAVSIAPIHNTRGDLLGLSVIARDNSAHQQVEAALREASRQKDEFLAIMSHELRTPLTSILGYTDMLLRGVAGTLEPRACKYLGNVRSAGHRLLELVDGLLDYTRLEAGSERLELRLLDLSEAVQHAVDRFREQAATKQLDLQVTVQPGLDRVLADRDKLQQVLLSYLGNAIKFTPSGGRVAVDVSQDREDPEYARVSVTDSGIGLRDDQLARVWERFYQADPSLTRSYGGMGLGLSIARHLVVLHGGRVGVESAGPGMGSTFWFSLPLAAS